MSKPLFIALGGSIGVGKTSLAYALRRSIPNVVIVENDTVRRQLLGYPLNYFMNHQHDNSFSDENNQYVIDEMNRLTKDAFDKGLTVIGCPTKNSEDEYKLYEKIYSDKAEFKGLFLKADENLIRQRIRKRMHERANIIELSVEKGHASDADENVLLRYPVYQKTPEGWSTIDATQSKEIVLQDALRILGIL